MANLFMDIIIITVNILNKVEYILQRRFIVFLPIRRARRAFGLPWLNAVGSGQRPRR